jgi:hypothetical protein
MSYRNDHDAALARVDVLERELATLRDRDREGHATREVQPRRKPWWLFGTGILALTAGIVGGVAIGATNGDEADVEVPRAAAPAFDRGRLDACLAPPATCRREVHAALDLAWLSGEERHLLTAWAAAEDELAGAASRHDVYYANDPAKLDGYSTAYQVRLEYDRAVAARDAAMARWRVSFR